MSPMITDATDKARAFWSRISMSQRVFIVGLALVTVGIFFTLILWINRPDYRVLYSNLAGEDANRVVKLLQANKVPYKLENDGGTVLVPADKLYDLRIKVAGEGNLVGQGIGFEIFDDLKVGQTDFVQKINYQRALQGELIRTISEFPGVETARVHLVIPHRSLFIEEQQKPSASVVVKLREGKKMEAQDVQAIVNLVVMAVEGMDRNRVSVADTSGKILYYPTEDDSLQGLTTTQLEYKMRLQQNLERRIEELLYPVIGPGKVIAKVNADVDFSQRTIRRELYDPEKTVVRSEQRSEESTRGRANLEAGAPDANFRGDGISGSASTQEGTRETRTTNFEINKEEQNIVANVGDLSRLSVAVIVDGTYEKAADGTYTFVPRNAEEMQRIRQLVSSAVGYDRARGDTVEVNSISFGGPDLPQEASLPQLFLDYALRLGKPLLNALLVFLFLLLVVRPVVMALIRPKVEGEMIEGLEGLPAGEERLALIEGDEEVDALDALRKIEDIKAHAMQLAEQNMDQAVGIIRSWLKNAEGTKAGAA
ncbi:flagellar basal-body MS-ring/collar protein FliF [Nitratidesulfovibrio vulgaris]|uniref:Flagellar M-ring protein n=1 Tax=Nitratidesulfovibrio vulgaris (strain DP4) TaxID=391774 RepID=A0A0H3ACX4_NITV4|nr:flagellar basal-body MS-ring/collar protein FliF [Nitratidesulfovibrio vulgaris]ABM29680.1 flagellar M-ring protein FliF [Nitratidesulfovibrio vulgaris DP4]WCB46996.1 flagellar basal-body MS-ring/collar protein FliF [Nitratidesulfovibrio vulgaris]GEB80144.1 flagellar M-ring protein [Desulfovibrio desulfuricans]HBW17448.1 flagellar M-ring protein FliF [Desulfovibrio sp.]